MKNLLLAALLLLAPTTWAAGLCVDTLTKQANFEQAMRALQPYKTLTAGHPEVVFRARQWKWQPDISLKLSIGGGKKIVVRALGDSELSTWRVAEALYQAQVQSRLFAPEQMLSAAEYTGPIGSDDAFEYFFARMPLEWRTERLKFLSQLNAEMYQLFSQLTTLNENTLLPARDPGRFSLWRVLRASDASMYIAPNREDYARWKASGDTGVAQSLNRRHARGLLFNYYMNYLRRFARVTIALQVLSLAPQIPEIPTAVEAAWVQMTGAPDPQVMHEEERLAKEIRTQQASSAPDQSVIAADESELQILINGDPRLPYTAP